MPWGQKTRTSHLYCILSSCKRVSKVISAAGSLLRYPQPGQVSNDWSVCATNPRWHFLNSLICAHRHEMVKVHFLHLSWLVHELHSSTLAITSYCPSKLGESPSNRK